MLCEICVGVLERQENELGEEERDHEREFGHHRTPGSLEAAATSGCYVCRKAWHGFSDEPQDEQNLYKAYYAQMQEEAVAQQSDVHSTWNSARYPSVNRFFTKVQINHDLIAELVSPDDLSLFVIVGHSSSKAGISPSKPMCVGAFILKKMLEVNPDSTSCSMAISASQDTLSERSMRQANDWLTHCRQSHSACKSTGSDADWLPTRLLRITEAQPSHYHVCLTLTALEKPSGPYATLSHRWGEAGHLKLTQDNLTTFREAIPISDLPKTFKEAIMVTFRLGLNYLWIDSLCIMQDEDDLSDWLREASTMNKVYIHSHCNLSASVSIDSTQGLSRRRDLALLYPPTVNFMTQGFDIKSGDDHVAYQVLDRDIFIYNISQAPINTRGWVFQEMMLAPRVLHFSHDQLFWECRQNTACEVLAKKPWHESNTETSHDVFKSYFAEHATSTTPVSSASATSLGKDKTKAYEVWHSLISNYSSRLLTKPLDKLIALSGIAKIMSAVLQGTYVAGMWQENLSKDILWRRLPLDDALRVGAQKNVLATRAAVYRAPTWSWASMDGYVDFLADRLESDQVQVHVTDVSLKHATKDTTGLVSGGWLDLRGKLRPMTVSSQPDQSRKVVSITWQIYIDAANPYKWDLFSDIHLDETTIDARHFDDDNAAGRLFYMICTRAPATGWARLKVHMYAMVLRVVEPDNGVFERIGMMKMNIREENTMEEVVPDIDESVRAKLPCLKYENGLHTIRII